MTRASVPAGVSRRGQEETVDFDYPPEAEELRRELRPWLDANLTERLRGARWANANDPNHPDVAVLREWNAKLADAGYAAIAWPEEYGGRGAGVMEQVVLAEEMSRADAPGTLNPIGISNIAPAIMQHGTEAQKRRILPRMLRGDDIWCQGFSEPDAGSDLASLRTSRRARWGRLRRQRPEGLEHPRAPGQLVRAARADRRRARRGTRASAACSST